MTTRKQSKKLKKLLKRARKLVTVTKHPPTGGIRLLSDFPYTDTKADPECIVGFDWVAGPCSVCRDSDAFERANFDAMCDELDTADPYGKDWDIIRFGHWGTGWVDVVFARPLSEAVRVLGRLRDNLQELPVLDGELCLEYQMIDEQAEKQAKAKEQEKIAC